MELVRRFFDPPKQSYFLFGPRGTGKSTWIREIYGDALYIDLLDPETERILRARPESLEERIDGVRGRTIVLDEVQKAPELLPVVHRLLEQKRDLFFVMTGSSARKLRRSGTDLLAGRALKMAFHPFMASELGASFDLVTALRLGMLPVVLSAKDQEATLRAYIWLYLREEVQAEGLTRNLGDFSRFLEVMSFSHGSILNMANVARDASVERRTAAGYLDILEDLMLGTTINVFTRRAKRAVIAHPKFYYFDAGVYRSLRRRGPLDVTSEVDGAALEGLVFQHLRALIAYGNKDCSISFWRTRGGSEVDFVLYGENIFCGIEVKNARMINTQDVRSLRAFHDEYPESTVFLLYRGKDRLRVLDVPCIPCDEFLRKLNPASTIESILQV